MNFMQLLPCILHDVKLVRKFKGRSYNFVDVLTIIICASICGLTSLKKIHLYAKSAVARTFFREHFEIEDIPSYSQLTRILAVIDTKSLNEIFTEWSSYATRQLSVSSDEIISIDGKSIRSTGKMKNYKKAIHIVSAIATNSCITLGQLAVSGKSNEIPALRDLIKTLDVTGCTIVADAMHCQKETCESVVEAGADYVFPVKDNQKILKEDIQNSIEHDSNIEIEFDSTFEKNRDRLEQRNAWVLNDISGIKNSGDWANLKSIGLVEGITYVDGSYRTETRYYISSKHLTPIQLINYTRNEWAIETMHWHLDVNFDEDKCRLKSEISQKSLNIIRKLALNKLKEYKLTTGNKSPISNLMFEALLNPEEICKILKTGVFV